MPSVCSVRLVIEAGVLATSITVVEQVFSGGASGLDRAAQGFADKFRLGLDRPPPLRFNQTPGRVQCLVELRPSELLPGPDSKHRVKFGLPLVHQDVLPRRFDQVPGFSRRRVGRVCLPHLQPNPLGLRPIRSPLLGGDPVPQFIAPGRHLGDPFPLAQEVRVQHGFVEPFPQTLRHVP